MPRVGLSARDVVAAAAALSDEAGFANLTLALVAERLGVRTPSLYKHVDGLADLRHRIATLAMTELGETLRDALIGVAGREALAALARAFRSYVTRHPGRYAATVGEPFTGPDDPLLTASRRVIDSIAAMLRGYRLPEEQIVHAIRTIRCTLHGFAALQAADGFQWSGDADDSFEWMIGFLDRGLHPTA
ncbi:WHG domain-containing protein [Streptosporangiaceae bacterium NEAU-GS5]|nr:WHG domain-containing protein [Streptosporangiaceae bacterium NEAU-GS5]